MDQLEIFLIFTGRLDHHRFDYMATGSVGSMLFGIPRLTHDLDLVLKLPASRIHELAACFPDDNFYCPPIEVMTVEANREQRGHFNLIHHDSGYKADVYLHGRDPLESWALNNRKRIDLSNSKGIWVAPPEYIIARKLEFFREGQSEKHLTDILGMFSLSADLIDRSTLTDWLEQRGTLALWKQHLAEISLA